MPISAGSGSRRVQRRTPRVCGRSRSRTSAPSRSRTSTSSPDGGSRSRSRQIEAKIVGAHRGGFCYELNGLFATLLEALGFRVSLLAAEVRSPETGAWGPPFDHLVLRVDLDGPWLVDVGFGDGCPEPLTLGTAPRFATGASASSA